MTNPVIETNIERILEDHLFAEIHCIDDKIKELTDSIIAYEARRKKLLNIADAAELTYKEDA